MNMRKQHLTSLVLIVSLFSVLFLSGFTVRDAPVPWSDETIIDGLKFSFECGEDVALRITNKRTEQAVLNLRTDAGRTRNVTVASGSTSTQYFLHINTSNRLHILEAGAELLVLPPCLSRSESIEGLVVRFECSLRSPYQLVNYEIRNTRSTAAAVSIHWETAQPYQEQIEPEGRLEDSNASMDYEALVIAEYNGGTGVQPVELFRISRCEVTRPAATEEPTEAPAPDPDACAIQSLNPERCTFAITGSGDCVASLQSICPSLVGTTDVSAVCSTDGATGPNISDPRSDGKNLKFAALQPDPKCNIAANDPLAGAAGAGSWVLPAAGATLALVVILGYLGWQRSGKRRQAGAHDSSSGEG
jgi:hypothetical protein